MSELQLESAPPELQQNANISFILRLGRALHQFGYASHRLEELLEQSSARLQLIGQFFSTPTSIYCGFGTLDQQKTYLIRAEPGHLNLGKLVDLDVILADVVNQRISANDGSARIDAIIAAPPAYGSAVNLCAYGAASAAASQFFGAGIKELCVAGCIGIVIGLLSLLAKRFVALDKVFDPVAAFAAAFLAHAGSHVFGPYSVFTTTLAGLIILMPGFTLTVALTELTTRNLVSGTSRLSSALIVFFGMGFGVTLGAKVSQLLFGVAYAGASWPLPTWSQNIALFVMPLAFAVLLKAHVRDFIWIILVVALAVYASRFGARFIGQELGPFIGALTVGLASTMYSHLLRRPSTVTLAPGILLLVPGSVGFRSIASLLDRQIVPGVETAVQMILTAMALVAGILIANILLPVRKR